MRPAAAVLSCTAAAVQELPGRACGKGGRRLVGSGRRAPRGGHGSAARAARRWLPTAADDTGAAAACGQWGEVVGREGALKRRRPTCNPCLCLPAHRQYVWWGRGGAPTERAVGAATDSAGAPRIRQRRRAGGIGGGERARSLETAASREQPSERGDKSQRPSLYQTRRTDMLHRRARETSPTDKSHRHVSEVSKGISRGQVLQTGHGDKSERNVWAIFIRRPWHVADTHPPPPSSAHVFDEESDDQRRRPPHRHHAPDRVHRVLAKRKQQPRSAAEQPPHRHIRPRHPPAHVGGR